MSLDVYKTVIGVGFTRNTISVFIKNQFFLFTCHFFVIICEMTSNFWMKIVTNLILHQIISVCMFLRRNKVIYTDLERHDKYNFQVKWNIYGL